jgi:hypothetical protein
MVLWRSGHAVLELASISVLAVRAAAHSREGSPASQLTSDRHQALLLPDLVGFYRLADEKSLARGCMSDEAEVSDSPGRIGRTTYVGRPARPSAAA